MSLRSTAVAAGKATHVDPPRTEPEEPIQASAAPWHERYQRACEQYQELDCCPELLNALASGLREWASLLPQTEVDAAGRHKPVNSWGLGAELKKLPMLCWQLSMDGRGDVSFQLERLAEDLHVTAKRLDECYPKQSVHDEQAEGRLVLTAQIQADVVAGLIDSLARPLFGTSQSLPTGSAQSCIPVNAPNEPSGKRTAPGRASRACAIEALTAELIAHINAARNAALTAIDMGRPPKLLRRPTKAQLGRQTGLRPWSVTRAFQDKHAGQLQALWDIADDLEHVLKF